MEFWFEELHTDNVKMSIRVDKQPRFPLRATISRSMYSIRRSLDASFARMAVLFSEADEFVYDEMIVHVLMGQASPCEARW